MKVQDLVKLLLELDQEKELNFCFGAEEGRSFFSGHQGGLDTDFDLEEEGTIRFHLSFEEENVYSE